MYIRPGLKQRALALAADHILVYTRAGALSEIDSALENIDAALE